VPHANTTRNLLVALLVVVLPLPCVAATGAPSPDRGAPTSQAITEERLAADDRRRVRRPRDLRRERVPGRGLHPHEGGAWRGHTLERHVGKSDADLRRRLDEARGTRGELSAASTFATRRNAEHFVGATLKRNESAIWRWLKSRNGPSSKAFTARFTEPTGRRMKLGQSRSESVHGTRVVLRRDSTSPSGYRIVSSFPVK